MKHIKGNLYEHNGILLAAYNGDSCQKCPFDNACRNNEEKGFNCCATIGDMYFEPALRNNKEETKMKIDFSKLPIGTRVWSFTKGWGTLERVIMDDVYPIKIRFDSSASISYIHDGCSFNAESQSLFLNSFEIPESAYVSPIPKLNRGDLIRITDINNTKFVYYREFCKYSVDGVGLIFYVEDGSTSTHFSDITKYKYELVKAANE